MTTWFVLTAVSLAYVAWDVRPTPAHPVLKWAFVLLTLFTGPFGAFFLRARLPGAAAEHP